MNSAGPVPASAAPASISRREQLRITLQSVASMAMLGGRPHSEYVQEPFSTAAQALASAVLGRNPKAIAQLHAAGAQVTLPTARAEDAGKAWATFLAAGNTGSHTKLTFERTEVSGSLAVGTGPWETVGPNGTEASGRFLSTWTKVDGKWRVQNFTATGPDALAAMLSLRRQRALHFVYEIINKENMIGAENIVSPQFGERMTTLNGLRGLEALNAFFARLKGIFPDLQYSVEDVIAGTNGVAIRMTGRGTHQGKYVGIEPTGKRIQYKEMIFLELRRDQDGQDKIVHWEVVPDRLAIVHLLGHTVGVTYPVALTEPGPVLR